MNRAGLMENHVSTDLTPDYFKDIESRVADMNTI